LRYPVGHRGSSARHGHHPMTRCRAPPRLPLAQTDDQQGHSMARTAGWDGRRRGCASTLGAARHAGTPTRHPSLSRVERRTLWRRRTFRPSPARCLLAAVLQLPRFFVMTPQTRPAAGASSKPASAGACQGERHARDLQWAGGRSSGVPDALRQRLDAAVADSERRRGNRPVGDRSRRTRRDRPALGRWLPNRCDRHAHGCVGRDRHGSHRGFWLRASAASRHGTVRLRPHTHLVTRQDAGRHPAARADSPSDPETAERLRVPPGFVAAGLSPAGVTIFLWGSARFGGLRNCRGRATPSRSLNRRRRQWTHARVEIPRAGAGRVRDSRDGAFPTNVAPGATIAPWMGSNRRATSSRSGGSRNWERGSTRCRPEPTRPTTGQTRVKPAPTTTTQDRQAGGARRCGPADDRRAAGRRRAQQGACGTSGGGAAFVAQDRGRDRHRHGEPQGQGGDRVRNLEEGQQLRQSQGSRPRGRGCAHRPRERSA